MREQRNEGTARVVMGKFVGAGRGEDGRKEHQPSIKHAESLLLHLIVHGQSGAG